MPHQWPKAHPKAPTPQGTKELNGKKLVKLKKKK